MPIPYCDLEVGSVYFGQWDGTGLEYFFKYLGQGDWTSGNSQLLSKGFWDKYTLPYLPNKKNITVLYKVNWDEVEDTDELKVSTTMSPPPQTPLLYKVVNIDASRTNNNQTVFKAY